MADQDKDDTSALEREAKRVEDMSRPKDPGRTDDAEQVKQEGVERVEQDTRVQKVAQQAKEAGADTDEANLNKDG